MDPLQDGNTIGYVYIFENNGSLKQDADNVLVKYEFNLTKTDEHGSNNYFDAYQFDCTDPSDGYQCGNRDVPMNPEDTWFQSRHYARHFSENW